MLIDYVSIGNRVRGARKKLGITQQTLAEISEQTPLTFHILKQAKQK